MSNEHSIPTWRSYEQMGHQRRLKLLTSKERRELDALEDLADHELHENVISGMGENPLKQHWKEERLLWKRLK